MAPGSPAPHTTHSQLNRSGGIVRLSGFPNSTVRVMLADDHQQTRAGLRRQLERHERIVVVGEAADGRDVLSLIEQVTLDVLLLDIEMKPMSGLDAMKQLSKMAPPFETLGLSNYSDPTYIFEMLAYGVAGYLSKEDPIDVIVEAIYQVADGKRCQLSPSLWTTLRQNAVSHPDLSFPPRIMKQARDVIRLVAAGYPDGHIAEHLKMPVRHVEEVLIQVCDALAFRDRAEVVAWAWAQGLLTPPPHMCPESP